MKNLSKSKYSYCNQSRKRKQFVIMSNFFFWHIDFKVVCFTDARTCLQVGKGLNIEKKKRGKFCLVTFKYLFIQVWWSASDLGWIVGHSYIAYAPLLAGNTTVIFEVYFLSLSYKQHFCSRHVLKHLSKDMENLCEWIIIF